VSIRNEPHRRRLQLLAPTVARCQVEPVVEVEAMRRRYRPTRALRVLSHSSMAPGIAPAEPRSATPGLGHDERLN